MIKKTIRWRLIRIASRIGLTWLLSEFKSARQIQICLFYFRMKEVIRQMPGDRSCMTFRGMDRLEDRQPQVQKDVVSEMMLFTLVNHKIFAAVACCTQSQQPDVSV